MKVLTLAGCMFCALFYAAESKPREQFRNADVQYDWVTNSAGQKLRTFITKPKTAAKKVPLIFFVGWLSCDSMEYADANTSDGFGILLRRLIDESGYATLRMDKLGVGESQGELLEGRFQERDFRMAGGI